jgi:hypothetical protein
MAGAITEARLLVEDLTRTHGHDHEETHVARRILAEYLCESGDAAEGIRRLTALYTESRALGPERLKATQLLRTTLIMALERNGDHEKALALLDEAIAERRGTADSRDDNGESADAAVQLLQDWRVRLVRQAGGAR